MEGTGFRQGKVSLNRYTGTGGRIFLLLSLQGEIDLPGLGGRGALVSPVDGEASLSGCDRGKGAWLCEN